MSVCKCGVSNTYPECDGTHKKIIKNEQIRAAILKAFKENEHLYIDNTEKSVWDD
jgi:CDGSH-type Zn-finger protein